MTVGTIKQPLLRQLYDFWDQKRGDRLAPRREDIDPLELPRPLIGSVFLYTVERDKPGSPPTDYVLRLFGTQLVEMFGGDMTGRSFDDIFHGPTAPAIRREYDHVAMTGEPLCSALDGRWADREYRFYRRLLLPLSENGRTVDRLFGGAVDEGACSQPDTSV